MSWIPQAVADLVLCCFHSIEALDLFVELRQIRPRSATAAALAARLGTSEGTVVTALQQLVDGGLVVQAGADSALRYVLHPSPRYEPAVVEALEDALRNDRLDLVALIGQQAIRRIRAGALGAFLRSGKPN